MNRKRPTDSDGRRRPRRSLETTATQRPEFAPPARRGRSTCFLCACRLTPRNRSDEDVIPLWIQRKFQLGDQLLHLPNATAIKYRQLKTPCCKQCNNEHLSRIENQMKRAVGSGVEAVRGLDPVVLFLWLGKVFYGLMYRDFLLLRDRRDSSHGPILPRKVLAHFAVHKFFLQAARRPFEFKPEIPASIFIFRTKSPKSVRAQAAFNDALAPMTISVRLGGVGILAALQDGGAQRQLASELANWRSTRMFRFIRSSLPILRRCFSTRPAC
jgi:hypothetical protein